MKALVTGGTGFTGSHLVRFLLEQGHDVTVLDVQKGIFDDELAGLGAKMRYGEIFDPALCDEATRGQDVVFHLAAAFRGVDLSKAEYRKINIEGTRVLANAALENKVRRFVYTSTEGVHGLVESPPMDESGPIAPKDYYSVTKYEGEKVVWEYMEKGLPSVVLRPTAIYGPGDVGRYLMIFKFAKRGWFPMFGPGKVHYHPVHVDNLNDAFIKAAERDEALGETYLIGDEDYVSLNTLVRMTGEAIGNKVRIWHFPYYPFLLLSILVEAVCRPLRITPPLFKRRAEWYWTNRGFSIEKAKRELGYKPTVKLKEGLEETGRWYVEHGHL